MIHHTDADFDFGLLHLSQPVATANGSFFSKINVSATDESLFIYTPKGVTKQGIVTTNNKSYTDLAFTTSNTNIIQWMTSLEERLQELIYEKRDNWFATENIELDDIQNAFIPLIKVYKHSQYVLRCYLPQSKQQIKGEPVNVYNENEQPCPLTSITDKTNIITILEIQGIKFSQKCFHVPIFIKQIMVFEKTSFSNCLIKGDKKEDKKEKEKEISLVNVNTDLLDETIEIKRPIDVYNASIAKVKKSTSQAKEAYLIARDIKQQFNLEDELPLL
jgi:hypothetical protein